jgi:hypothetical protein
MTTNSVKKYFIVPDLHTPYHDVKAVALAKQIYDAFNPDSTIFIGDNRDFIWASRFFVPHEQRKGAVIKELRAWEAVSGLFKSKETLHLRGNHEGRLLEYLDRNPELEGLEGFTVKSLYPGLVRGDHVAIAQGSFIVTHGSVIRSSPGQSAWGEMQKWGRSGCSGHSHRLSRHYHRNYSGVRVWLECGHLALNPPHYRRVNNPAPENWQQGCVLIYVEGNQFHAEEIPFTLHYRAMFNGRKYQA